MTLLEALLATVILSVVAIACLEGTRGAASLQRRASTMAEGVAVAEAALAQAAVDAPVEQQGVRVTRAAYVPNGRMSTLDRISVEVPVAGGMVRLSRLVPRVVARPQRAVASGRP
jgi:type II secretory pathway pseudopilin PulG